MNLTGFAIWFPIFFSPLLLLQLSGINSMELGLWKDQINHTSYGLHKSLYSPVYGIHKCSSHAWRNMNTTLLISKNWNAFLECGAVYHDRNEGTWPRTRTAGRTYRISGFWAQYAVLPLWFWDCHTLSTTMLWDCHHSISQVRIRSTVQVLEYDIL